MIISGKEQLRNVQRHLLKKARIKGGEKILDVCCGSGLLTFPAASAAGPGGGSDRHGYFGTDAGDRSAFSR